MQPKKTIYTLTEAAAVLKCTVESILVHAATGACHLYVRVPSTCILFSVDERHLGRGQYVSGQDKQAYLRRIRYTHGRPFPPVLLSTQMMMLEIGKEDCESLNRTEFVEQSVFDFGLKIMPDGALNRHRAALPGPEEDEFSLYRNFPSRTRKFAIYPVTHPDSLDDDDSRWRRPASLSIAKSELLLSSEEFLQLKEAPSALRERFSQDIPLPEGRHVSTALRHLYAVLLDQWTMAVNSDEKLLPQNGVIAELLLKADDELYSKHSAEYGARIIKQSSIMHHPDGRLHLSAPWVAAMIDHLADWEFNLGNPVREPTIDWMAEKLLADGLPERVARVAASLLRPDDAIIGRRVQPR
jgi:hypothetical protein